MFYTRALMLGEVQKFPLYISDYFPQYLRFVHTFIREGTEFERLTDYLQDTFKGKTQWLIDDLKLKNDALSESQLFNAFEVCDCLVVISHYSDFYELPHYIASAITFAQSIGKQYLLIRLPLPNQSIDYKATGQAITERRCMLGMTQSELANHIKRSQKDIEDIECGKLKPRVKTYLAISRVLRCDVSEYPIYEDA